MSFGEESSKIIHHNSVLMGGEKVCNVPASRFCSISNRHIGMTLEEGRTTQRKEECRAGVRPKFGYFVVEFLFVDGCGTDNNRV